MNKNHLSTHSKCLIACGCGHAAALGEGVCGLERNGDHCARVMLRYIWLIQPDIYDTSGVNYERKNIDTYNNN